MCEEDELIVWRLDTSVFGRELNNAGNWSAGCVKALVEFVAHFEEGLLDRKLKVRRMSPAIDTLDIRNIAPVVERSHLRRRLLYQIV